VPAWASFTQLARNAVLSQSAGLRIVADLEAELEARLTCRATTRAVVPNEAAGEFLARIEPILAALDDAETAVREGGELSGLYEDEHATSFGIRE